MKNFIRQVSSLHNMSGSFFQRLGFSSPASSESAEKEALRNGSEKVTAEENGVASKVKLDEEAKEHSGYICFFFVAVWICCFRL